MNSNNQSRNILLIASLSILVILRLLPHPANFIPLGAISILGAYFMASKKNVYWLPLAVMLLSDILLELSYRIGYSAFPGFNATMLFVYPSFMLMAMLGKWAGNKQTIPALVTSIIGGSLLFFVITNFGYWLLYMPKSFEGLMQSYVQAIPFYRSSLLGDMIYTIGGYIIIRQVLSYFAPATHKMA